MLTRTPLIGAGGYSPMTDGSLAVTVSSGKSAEFRPREAPDTPDKGGCFRREHLSLTVPLM